MVLERRTLHDVPGLSCDAGPSPLAGTTLDPGTLRFMDTETTGLSGGAGTTVFLIGVGTIDCGGQRPRVELRQTLLTDFPGEPAFLERTLSLLGRETVWISYNGKAFDARLLETRCIMNGIRPATPIHMDLLTWARRFWGTIFRDCSLSTVERMVLNRGRSDDISGEEIPQRYFAFLDEQRTELLDPVVDHHSRDIVSLVHLLVTLERLIHSRQPHVPFDRVQVARRLLGASPEIATDLLLSAIRDGDSDAERAGALLMHRYRMIGMTDAAAELAARLRKPESVVLLEETAKLYEHDLKEPATALAMCEAFMLRNPTIGPLLARRIERLRRKAVATASAEQGR